MIYDDVKKIYGPYLGKDGRLRIQIIRNDGTSSFKSYPKYLMEIDI